MCQKCDVLHIFDTCFVQKYTFSTFEANFTSNFFVIIYCCPVKLIMWSKTG